MERKSALRLKLYENLESYQARPGNGSDYGMG